ncbi:MAG TPA: anhydro-N-acetylmuramic acid kinase [Candidatus Acidoferrales bacterium]|nr:anhydro-N-acetylmuramic acid kinase [Candidatus Acidoferrales bacterium]
MSAMRVLGMMSGTSADGIDVALVRVNGRPPRLGARLDGFACFTYPPRVRRELLRIASGAPVPAGDIARLNFLLGELFARAALDACRKFRIAPRSVQLIGSHGQTIFHQGGPAPYLGARRIAATLQIAEPAVIAARTGVPVVGDFRPSDLAAGGQGAPLVPFVDFLLYRHARRSRVALNIGGIANLTAIPAGARAEEVIAFDTGPGNMLIDALASHFSGGRLRYDRDARLARRGSIAPELLAVLRDDPYFRKRPPKTAGREQFGSDFVQRALAGAKRNVLRPEDVLHTVTLLTPLTILDALRRWVEPRMHVDDLIVSGGGAHNPLVMAHLAAGLPGVRIIRSGQFGVPEDAKEAFAFAVLAYETFHGRPANLPSATGAGRPAVLGKIAHP